jgi:hypothetical protein
VVLESMKACLPKILPKVKHAAAVMIVVAGSSSLVATAQEGHPLKGSWLGTWESNDVHGEFVLLILDWDGEKISGMINPGTDNIEIREASLNPDGWVVTFEAASDDVRYEIEGRIENLELPDRSIVGTWRREGSSGAFEVSRQ